MVQETENKIKKFAVLSKKFGLVNAHKIVSSPTPKKVSVSKSAVVTYPISVSVPYGASAETIGGKTYIEYPIQQPGSPIGEIAKVGESNVGYYKTPPYTATKQELTDYTKAVYNQQIQKIDFYKSTINPKETYIYEGKETPGIEIMFDYQKQKIDLTKQRNETLTDLSSLPSDLKYYPSEGEYKPLITTEYLKKQVGEQRWNTEVELLAKSNAEKFIKTPQTLIPEFHINILGFNLGWGEVKQPQWMADLNVSAVDVYKYGEAEQQLKDIYMNKEGDVWGNLGSRNKALYSFRQAGIQAITWPVTLPQAIIKYATGGKTLLLPDVATETEKHFPTVSGAPSGLLSTGLSEGIGKATGQESDAFQRYIKDPWSGASATVGEITSLGAGGKIAGKIWGAGKTGIKYSIGKLPDVVSKLEYEFPGLTKVTSKFKTPGLSKTYQNFYNYMVEGYRPGKTLVEVPRGTPKEGLYNIQGYVYKPDKSIGYLDRRIWLSPGEQASYKTLLKSSGRFDISFPSFRGTAGVGNAEMVTEANLFGKNIITGGLKKKWYIWNKAEIDIGTQAGRLSGEFDYFKAPGFIRGKGGITEMGVDVGFRGDIPLSLQKWGGYDELVKSIHSGYTMEKPIITMTIGKDIEQFGVRGFIYPAWKSGVAVTSEKAVWGFRTPSMFSKQAFKDFLGDTRGIGEISKSDIRLIGGSKTGSSRNITSFYPSIKVPSTGISLSGLNYLGSLGALGISTKPYSMQIKNVGEINLSNIKYGQITKQYQNQIVAPVNISTPMSISLSKQGSLTKQLVEQETVQRQLLKQSSQYDIVKRGVYPQMPSYKELNTSRIIGGFVELPRHGGGNNFSLFGRSLNPKYMFREFKFIENILNYPDFNTKKRKRNKK